jgi:outer membrane protein assembly factor BamB
MKSRHLLFWFVLVAALAAAADWPSQSGGPERENWAKSERTISKADVAGLTTLYTFSPEEHSAPSLSAPIINGNLITYRGFKEMLVFSADSNRVFSVDADLNKLIWESHWQTSAASNCGSAASAPVVMAGSSSATLHFAAPPPRPPGAPPVRRRRSPYFPPLSQSLYPLLPTTLTQLNAMYTVSADGALHILNSSTGEDLLPPAPFVPANSIVGSLNLRDNFVYATTAESCGKQNALYAIDLLSPDKHVYSFAPARGGFAGLDGTALAPDGTIFVQVDSSPDDKPGHAHETLLALGPKDLKVKSFFTPANKELSKKYSAPGITPMVFRWHGKTTVIAGFSDGRLYLLDASSLGGPDHKTPLLRSEVFTAHGKNFDGTGFRGAFAGWPDIDGDKQWFYAPVVSATDSGVQAFRLGESDGRLELECMWTSHGMLSPDPPVVANGLLFALSTGNSARTAKKNGRPYTVAERKAMTKPAVLYAFDAVTGQQVYSSGQTIPVAAQPNGMAVANARIYFSGEDGRVYCFGLPKTQPQLAEQQHQQ